MSKTFKIILILLVVASIASSVLAVLFYLGKEREYMRRLLIEDKLAATLKDKARVEKELDAKKKAYELSQLKISKLEKDISDLTATLESNKERTKNIAQALADKKEELSRMKTDLEKEKKEKLTISKELEDLKFQYDRMTKVVDKIRGEKSKLQEELKKLQEQTVNLDKIVVKPQPTPPAEVKKEPPKPQLNGRVLVVNKEYSFIVVDIGQDDGVEKGMTFDIKDGSLTIGRAQVDKVYETMSSATLLPGTDINSIRKGNLVIESR